jgi:hypothetical protein
METSEMSLRLNNRQGPIWGQEPYLVHRHRDDLAIADDLVLPMKA